MAIALDCPHVPRLQHVGAGSTGPVEQQHVEGFATQRSAPAMALIGCRRQVRDDTRTGPHQRNAAQLGTRTRIECRTEPERIEQRQVARRNAFTAYLAARETLFLDQRDRKPRVGEQDRSRTAGRARANDQCIKAVAHSQARRAPRENND